MFPRVQTAAARVSREILTANATFKCHILRLQTSSVPRISQQLHRYTANCAPSQNLDEFILSWTSSRRRLRPFHLTRPVSTRLTGTAMTYLATSGELHTERLDCGGGQTGQRWLTLNVIGTMGHINYEFFSRCFYLCLDRKLPGTVTDKSGRSLSSPWDAWQIFESFKCFVSGICWTSVHSYGTGSSPVAYQQAK